VISIVAGLPGCRQQPFAGALPVTEPPRRMIGDMQICALEPLTEGAISRAYRPISRDFGPPLAQRGQGVSGLMGVYLAWDKLPPGHHLDFVLLDLLQLV
jgi:hypothetical protein